MQLSSQMAAIGIMVQMCGSTGPSTDTASEGYNCRDLEIIIDVEMIVARECDADSECSMVLAEETCESNSVLVHEDYDSDYFYDLMDQANALGCEIELPRNNDCSATTPVCDVGVCSWQ